MPAHPVDLEFHDLVNIHPLSARLLSEVDLELVHASIQTLRKLQIAYADALGGRTRLTIWPVAITYYVHVTLVAG